MEQDDVVISLAASLSGETKEEYVRNMQYLLANLEKLENPKTLNSDKDYARARRIKSALCSLSCYAFNTDHPQSDRICSAEGQWAQVLGAYNRRFLIRDAEIKLLANYLLWNRRYTQLDEHALIAIAVDKGILLRRDGRIYVVGLEKRVGNNVFSVDRFKRHHRQYLRTIGRQAFCVTWDCYLDAARPHLERIGELDDECEVTSLGDGKYVAKPPRMPRDCHRRLSTLIKQWREGADNAAMEAARAKADECQAEVQVPLSFDMPLCAESEVKAA